MARKRKPVVEVSNETLELKKHVAIIHSGNRLSLLQRKIANALLFNAYDDLLIKDEHEIHMMSLCRLIGYDSNDHKTIKKSLINLLSTVLEWNLVDGEKLDEAGVWNASSIIADASIHGSICAYSYSNKMRKLLHRPNIYGRLDMLVQAKFQSSYGLALYENCNRFQDIGRSPWFEIEKFRKLMGVEQNKYLIFRDFKTRVIDKAVEEINKYSPLRVDPQLRKLSRRVTAIQFLISKKDGRTTLLLPINHEKENLSELLKLQFGFSKRQVAATLSSYHEDYIREKVMLVKQSSSFNEGKIINLAKYLFCALKDDYQEAKQKNSRRSKTQSVVIKREESRATRAADLDKKKQLEQDNMLKYRYYQDKCLINLFYQLSAAAKKVIMKEFKKYMHTAARGVYVDIYIRDGLANPLVQDQLCLFLRQTREDLLSPILSYAKWKQSKSSEHV